MTTTLRESTGSPTADKVLQGVVGIFEQLFPDRVRGYFVRGSYASATSTEGSDLDMFVLFKDDFIEPAEARKARYLCRHCALLSPILLEILVVSERQLQREGTFYGFDQWLIPGSEGADVQHEAARRHGGLDRDRAHRPSDRPLRA